MWPQCRKLNRGIFRTDGARSLQTLGCSGQVWGRKGAAFPTWVPVPVGPPAASPFLPCRGLPPWGVCPARTRAPPRGNGAATTAPAGTAGVETRPSQLRHRRSCRRSARGRERPLTLRWPCPQAGPASRGIRPSGPTGTSASLHCFFWVFLSNPPPPPPPPGAGRAIKRPSSRSEVPSNPVPRNQARPPSHVRLGPERLAGVSGVVQSRSLARRPRTLTVGDALPGSGHGLHSQASSF